MSKKTEFTFHSVLLEADQAQEVISGKLNVVGAHLFTLAQGMSTPDQFEAGCEAAESARRQVLSEKSVEEGLTKKQRKDRLRLPGAWSNAKSVLLRGWMDHGLIPNDYETYSQYKDAKADSVKASKVKVTNETSEETTDAAKDAISAVGKEGSVTAVLFGDIFSRIAALPTEIQEEISLHLDELVAKYEGNTSQDADIMEALENEQIRQAGGQ